MEALNLLAGKLIIQKIQQNDCDFIESILVEN
ncbi:hypothetical protein C8N25_12735 [Algoriphagus antarcticus]|uniref:Uncharacterized protein n=1 Tax=Algoriphagus antarcticus TaxID=238540 RepID=A0A3E0DH36_9BACT|nr:hypothetical protein C8N25_12735 [Algoriphagus antarcticus]